MKKIIQNFTNIKDNLKVKDVMSKKVIFLSKDKYVNEAIKVMAENSISTIVIEENNKLLGILTERDLVKKILYKEKDPKKIKIQDIMSKEPIYVYPDAPILVAANTMKEHKVRKLVVLNEKKEVIGIISQTDIINSLNKIYEEYSTIFMNPILYFILVIFIIIMVILSLIIF
ncbi:MAG: CBS domain-containing protein [Candidatus Woesearchaeota archaeon]